MTKQILEGLFESRVRVRILRFLFRNFPGYFSLNAITSHVQASRGEVRRELKRLAEINLIKLKLKRIVRR